MTRNETMALTEKVGLTSLSLIDVAYLESFAELVATSEREACAKLEYEAGIYSKHDMAEAIRARSQA